MLFGVEVSCRLPSGSPDRRQANSTRLEERWRKTVCFLGTGWGFAAPECDGLIIRRIAKHRAAV